MGELLLRPTQRVPLSISLHKNCTADFDQTPATGFGAVTTKRLAVQRPEQMMYATKFTILLKLGTGFNWIINQAFFLKKAAGRLAYHPWIIIHTSKTAYSSQNDAIAFHTKDVHRNITITSEKKEEKNQNHMYCNECEQDARIDNPNWVCFTEYIWNQQHFASMMTDVTSPPQVGRGCNICHHTPLALQIAVVFGANM